MPAPLAVHTAVKLEDLPSAELLKRVDRYDHAVGASREVLIARFAEAEKKIAALTHSHPTESVPASGGTVAPAPVAGPSRPAGNVNAQVPVGNLQKALNAFTRRYLHGLAPIAVDGAKGPETNKRIREVKYYLGYGKGPRPAAVDKAFIKRLSKPSAVRFSNPAMLARGRARRGKQKQHSTQSLAQHDGTVPIDGYRVASWIAAHVLWARANGWHGKVLSGYRTPEYSEHYCMKTYGAPRVPGRCAGRSSNHVGLIAPAGAVDVSEHAQFAAAMRHSPHRPTLCNALPTDLNHFSNSGH